MITLMILIRLPLLSLKDRHARIDSNFDRRTERISIQKESLSIP
jgi:hypothetical protein